MITSPVPSAAQVSDFKTGKYDDGRTIAYGQSEPRLYRANADIAVGQIVNFVVPTTTAPVSVAPATVNSTLTAGVAAKATKAGQLCPVIHEGHAFVLGGGVTAAGDAIGSNGSGKAVKVTPDATTVAGAILGICLAIGAADTLVPCIIAPR